MKKKISEEQNRKLEMICVAALIVFALLSFFLTKLKNSKNSEYQKVVIYVESNSIWECKIDDLIDEKVIIYNEDDSPKTKVLMDDYSDIKEKYEYNVIEINNKKISCIDSNCPNKICIKHGTLNSSIDNDMIICAPHKMTIIYE